MCGSSTIKRCHVQVIVLRTSEPRFNIKMVSSYLNPLAAELLYETKIYISHFSSLLNIQTANVNHISHKGRPEHSWQMRKISCLLMPWRRKELGHQQACNLPVSPWYIMVQQREGQLSECFVFCMIGEGCTSGQERNRGLQLHWNGQEVITKIITLRQWIIGQSTVKAKWYHWHVRETYNCLI